MEEKTGGNPYWNKIHKLEQRIVVLEKKVEILTKIMGRK